MAQSGVDTTDDLFLELAQDQQHTVELEQDARPTSRGTLSGSKLSQVRQRRTSATESLLGSARERRDSISGQTAGRTPSRLDSPSNALQQYVDGMRRPDSRRSNADETASMSGLGNHSFRRGGAQDWSARPMSRLTEIRSPEPPSYGRRRPSFGFPSHQHSRSLSKPLDLSDESPAEKSEHRNSNADSTSIDSQTADTVWDELDDLKSRIKKLELTGKLPSASHGAGSGDSSERPRTATTAPTTIDSSPKHDRKPELDIITSPPNSSGSNGVSTNNIHPLLHEALAKAKPLLNSSLYRMLEATASEALQIAALTGSAGPQGTTFSAASVINGATVSDRHVRRKADNMCRNLTDLCLALCEGKHEAPSYAASPATLSTPIMMRSSPTVRQSRSNTGLDEGLNRSLGRAPSRLEARRSSILGSYAASSYVSGSRESIEGGSGSDRETTPPRPRVRPLGLRRVSRASDRLRGSRAQLYDEANSNFDDSSVRPPSRAMTDIGGFRSSQNSSGGPRGFNSPNLNINRTSNLRESLSLRRAANSGAHNANRELTHHGSFSSDTGRHDRSPEHQSTPVLVEEDGSEFGGYRSYLRPKRRMASMSSSFSARHPQDLPSRAASLSSRRPVMAE